MKTRSTEFTEASKIEAFRLPKFLSAAARKKAKDEDLSFSQLMRRAVRRELGMTGQLTEQESQT